MKRLGYVATLSLGILGSSPAWADTAAPYQGRSLTMIAGNSAGGGYDQYARLLARHITKHIAGQPNIVVQNMAGAGGLIAANHLFNVAPRDGATFAMFPGSILLDGVLGNENAKFSSEGFTPIGNMNAESDTCIAWNGRGVTTADDVFKKDVVTGATGVSSNSYIYPALMNTVLGTKFKLITGYNGNERVMIMEKGELDAACGVFTSTLLSVFAEQVRTKKVLVLLQMGLERHPSLPDTPSALDLAKSADDRQILSLAFSPLEMGRAFFAPPGIPADKTAILQRAFADAMRDKDLLAEAGKANMELRWFDGARLATVIAGMAAVPEPVRLRARQLLIKK